jgi:hypothetical protein
VFPLAAKKAVMHHALAQQKQQIKKDHYKDQSPDSAHARCWLESRTRAREVLHPVRPYDPVDAIFALHVLARLVGLYAAWLRPAG